MLYSSILPEDKAYELVKEALKCSIVSCDTETSDQDVRDGRGYALGISIAWWGVDRQVTALYLPFRHRNLGGLANYNLQRFLPLLQEILDKSTVIYHNAKFDLVSLSTLGLQTLGRRRFVCTMVLAHLVDENRPFAGKSLDSCSKFYLKDQKYKEEISDWVSGTKIKKVMAGTGISPWEMLTPAVICEYAAKDAELTLRLYEALSKLAKAENLGETWKHKMDFTQVLIDMESNGIEIDTELCDKMAEQGESEMKRLTKELGGLNAASPIDLKTLLIDKLGLPYVYHPKTHKPTFDKSAMETYEIILARENNETAQNILAYRGWQKSTSSNYKPYVQLLSPDGRLRPNYLMHGTVTGRLSCRNPNLQQIPKSGKKPWNGEMKSCFRAREGYELVTIDYSQLELRVGAAYAEEESLIKVFAEDRDIFDEMARLVFPEIYKRNPQEARNKYMKTTVYTIQYGGGVNRLATVFGIPTQRAAEIRQQYYNAYPGFRIATEAASDLVKRNRRIKLWSGRYRHFLYPNEDCYKAFNSVIQGGSADIMERAMLRIYHMEIPADECRMLLQIHDEIVFEIRKDLVYYYRPILVEAMSRVDYHPNFTKVKFAAKPSKWGEK